MQTVYNFLDTILPFEFMSYAFMKNAFLAILLSSPIFALVGTMIVNKKMAFFSDALGHSALTGIAVGVIFGITNRSLAMCLFAIVFAVLLNIVKDKTTYGADTIIGVFASVALSLGLAILSKSKGGFNTYQSYLVGDLLSISWEEVIYLFVALIAVLIFWFVTFNQLNAASISISLARSKGIKSKVSDYIFSAFIAVIVMLSIRWIGILLINSLIILPAAISRNISRNMRSYHLFSVISSLVAGIVGLIASYYISVPTGPMIVIILGIAFAISFVVKRRKA